MHNSHPQSHRDCDATRSRKWSTAARRQWNPPTHERWQSVAVGTKGKPHLQSRQAYYAEKEGERVAKGQLVNMAEHNKSAMARHELMSLKQKKS